jgi:hypothetical protein
VLVEVGAAGGAGVVRAALAPDLLAAGLIGVPVVSTRIDSGTGVEAGRAHSISATAIGRHGIFCRLQDCEHRDDPGCATRRRTVPFARAIARAVIVGDLRTQPVSDCTPMRAMAADGRDAKEGECANAPPGRRCVAKIGEGSAHVSGPR